MSPNIWIKAKICEKMTTSRGQMTFQRIVDWFAFDRLGDVVNVLTDMYIEGNIESFNGIVHFTQPDSAQSSSSFSFTHRIISGFIEDSQV